MVWPVVRGIDLLPDLLLLNEHLRIKNEAAEKLQPRFLLHEKLSRIISESRLSTQGFLWNDGFGSRGPLR